MKWGSRSRSVQSRRAVRSRHRRFHSSLVTSSVHVPSGRACNQSPSWHDARARTTFERKQHCILSLPTFCHCRDTPPPVRSRLPCQDRPRDPSVYSQPCPRSQDRMRCTEYGYSCTVLSCTVVAFHKVFSQAAVAPTVNTVRHTMRVAHSRFGQCGPVSCGIIDY